MSTLALTLLTFFAVGAEGSVEKDEQVHAFLQRLELQPVKIDGEAASRVTRNEQGEISRIRLDGMLLIDDDWRAIEKISTLQSLNLAGTNVTSDDLKHLTALPNLRGIVLNTTDISDKAVAYLSAIPDLRSVCLMDSLLSREAIDTLKAAKPKLGIGYTRRE